MQLIDGQKKAPLKGAVTIGITTEIKRILLRCIQSGVVDNVQQSQLHISSWQIAGHYTHVRSFSNPDHAKN
ncbi:hypothetical protein BL250_01520 [Erwinia sp. OLTSP20]|uniref:hypothetical protein n=1 Tax=Erwinia sp. OAMSP11 TaxID=1933285 RepID=UPI000C1740B8|nr:hypothetical protein [Erwinia sp. OAMSP11]PIJ73728.1 hypothetical protein BK416_06380 [Erwinia sp. OLSSP12]PIJ83085.1 hypothetical protein BLD47_05875 [Erwinia sp. OLCASP19]PIJ85683.1 hypothetical protein BLD46_05905 [Erwinia sp. OLMTSP26]PIJ87666.1 hypothetical protein BLD49_05210 [Erwinia sp. OLMDSP33]PIJ94777.1 hypothetical protein BL249_01950 [Erwinia sp. OLFS4]PIJ95023.1 hypothetical protein BL250_01520 [Erwinia sp. OLTSP20]